MLETAKKHMSTSQFKDFACGCELAAYKKHVTREYKEPDKKVFMVGRFIHAFFEGESAFNQFIKENHSELHKKTGGLYADFQKALENAELSTKIKKFTVLFDGTAEAEYKAEMFGVEWIIRVDNINMDKEFFTDLKYVKSLGYDWITFYYNDFGVESRRKDRTHTLKRRRYMPFYEVYNYWVQMAIYQKILLLATGKKMLPMIGAISKESPPDLGIFFFDNDERIEKELKFIERSMPRIKALKNGEAEPEKCGMCEICRMHNIDAGDIQINKAESHLATLERN